MSRLMEPSERNVARALAHFIADGDDRIEVVVAGRVIGYAQASSSEVAYGLTAHTLSVSLDDETFEISIAARRLGR